MAASLEEILLCSKLHDDQGFAFGQAAYGGAANGFGEMTSSHRHCIFRCMILTDHVYTALPGEIYHTLLGRYRK
jgi:hypothetical protein